MYCIKRKGMCNITFTDSVSGNKLMTVPTVFGFHFNAQYPNNKAGTRSLFGATSKTSCVRPLPQNECEKY